MLKVSSHVLEDLDGFIKGIVVDGIFDIILDLLFDTMKVETEFDLEPYISANSVTCFITQWGWTLKAAIANSHSS